MDGAILMFDLTSRVSYRDMIQWYHDVERVRGKDINSIPMVVVGNKQDCLQKLKPEQITFPSRRNFAYYPVSVRNSPNLLLDPVWKLVQLLSGDPTLQLAPSPVPYPPIQFLVPKGDAQTVSLKEAATVPLPDDEGGENLN